MAERIVEMPNPFFVTEGRNNVMAGWIDVTAGWIDVTADRISEMAGRTGCRDLSPSWLWLASRFTWWGIMVFTAWGTLPASVSRSFRYSRY